MLSDEHRAHTNRRHNCVPIKPLPGSTASALILIYVASVEVETCLLQAIRYRDSPFRFEMLTSQVLFENEHGTQIHKGWLYYLVY